MWSIIAFYDWYCMCLDLCTHSNAFNKSHWQLRQLKASSRQLRAIPLFRTDLDSEHPEEGLLHFTSVSGWYTQKFEAGVSMHP